MFFCEGGAAGGCFFGRCGGRSATFWGLLEVISLGKRGGK